MAAAALWWAALTATAVYSFGYAVSAGHAAPQSTTTRDADGDLNGGASFFF